MEGGTDGYGASTYGDRIAEVYDEFHEAPRDSGATVALLEDLARGGKALELGIGTGRIALELARRGVEIHGVDASEAMVAKLRAKEGGEAIPVWMGSFEEFDLEERYSLVFVVFNTFFGLLTQEAQVRCFRTVARHLAPEGVFLLECFVPEVARFEDGQTVRAQEVRVDHVRLETSRHDPARQRVDSMHVVLSEKGIWTYPVQIRYAHPSELDLMARLAGLRLQSRWGGFRRQPYTPSSEVHVSVYEGADS